MDPVLYADTINFVRYNADTTCTKSFSVAEFDVSMLDLWVLLPDNSTFNKSQINTFLFLQLSYVQATILSNDGNAWKCVSHFGYIKGG